MERQLKGGKLRKSSRCVKNLKNFAFLTSRATLPDARARHDQTYPGVSGPCQKEDWEIDGNCKEIGNLVTFSS